jgi:hypothetical protein
MEAIAMMKYLILAAAVTLTAFPLPAGACTAPSATAPALCATHLPPILSVQIDENAAVAPAAEGDGYSCSNFKVSAEAVRRFFSHAEATDQRQALNTLGWSPCYASGTLKFADGKLAGWSIHRYRTGSLAIVGGRRLYVYCPECAFAPFR